MCGLAADSDSVRTPSRQQVARDETEEPLIPLYILPYTFSLSLQPANRQGQRCMQLLSDALTLDGLDWTGLDWTGLALPRLLPPKG